jgi:hypothetical protein
MLRGQRLGELVEPLGAWARPCDTAKGGRHAPGTARDLVTPELSHYQLMLVQRIGELEERFERG